MTKTHQKHIEVHAHWEGLPKSILVGTLNATPSRGKEIFSFEYDPDWLKSKYAQALDRIGVKLQVR